MIQSWHDQKTSFLFLAASLPGYFCLSQGIPFLSPQDRHHSENWRKSMNAMGLPSFILLSIDSRIIY